MLKVKLFLIIFWLKCTLLTAENVQEKMEADGIIPHIIDQAPSSELIVIYPGGKTVKPGEELTPTDVKDEPQTKWNADPEKYYTLIMFDPDAPSRENPKFADVKHWLVVNILGCDVDKGDTIAEYFGSGPPKGTGLHRYIFLVFEQSGHQLVFDEPRSLKLSRGNRLSWSLKEFLKKYGLDKIVAGNYFKAQWDPYVDERNKFVTND